MYRLIHDLFAAEFDSPSLDVTHDGAVLELSGRIAVSTDAFTVQPLFFPGGDIGSLAITGTVNDVAMCGAEPRYLTASFVLEEGLPLADLTRIARSMACTAREAGVAIVAGDTKVVERGSGDGVFVTTTGFGRVVCDPPPHPSRMLLGDAIVINGPVGDHGAAVLAAREDLGVSGPLKSDAAPLVEPVLALLQSRIDVHALRDPTRGGLATTLCELANTCGHGLRIKEADVPIRPAVADLCELLGLDPLYVACEGRFIAVVPAGDEEFALALLRDLPGQSPRTIGYVVEEPRATVVLASETGGERVLDMLSGEQLPRIC